MSSGKELQFNIGYLTSSVQEWQFQYDIDVWWSRMAITHCCCHLVVKNGNLTLLLTSSGQEWQLLKLLLILSGGKWQLHCY